MEILKLKDLSIGDWVAYEGKAYRLYAIEECGTLRGKTEDEESVSHILKHIDYFDPIPITPEILEKAGYEGYKSLDVMMFACDDTHNVWENSFGWNIGGLQWGMFINYVHQLQHALRLAGIDKEITL